MKYCRKCADEAAREKSIEGQRKIRAQNKKKKIPVATCDSQSQINLCLNCTRKKCDYGKCEEVLSMRRRNRHSSPEEIAQRRENVFRMIVEQRKSIAQTAQELGFSVHTIANDLKVLGDIEVEK
jgi:DNA-binding CsgD family transcriptional regulator